MRCQRMMHGTFLRDYICRQWRTLNGAFNRELGGFVIPVLYLGVVFRIPMDEDADTAKDVVGLGQRYYAFLDAVGHGFGHTGLCRTEHLHRPPGILDIDL